MIRWDCKACGSVQEVAASMTRTHFHCPRCNTVSIVPDPKPTDEDKPRETPPQLRLISFPCPICNAEMTVYERFALTSVMCTTCKQPCRVPASQTAADILAGKRSASTPVTKAGRRRAARARRPEAACAVLIFLCVIAGFCFWPFWILAGVLVLLSMVSRS
jgi:transcription elongation factor Elf1